jgi:hypothetical protein
LQLSYELEAERLRNQHLSEANKQLHIALEEEEKRAESGGKIFVIAMFVGAAFFGSIYTASKAFR